ncbi:MAG TPA: hypothetical protein VL137_18080 [Polyangiaceae bacterium]|nr:hypothetical protein [Polyangiaceae bacterium]
MLHPAAERSAKHGIVRRIATKVAKAAGITLLIVTLVVLLAALWVNSPWGRNWIKREVTTALAPLFRGKLTILEIGWIGFGAASGVDAVLDDETGHQVLLVQDAEAQIDVLTAVASLLSSNADIELNFSRARIEHADALLDTNREGLPILAQAFQLAHPSPTPPQQPEKAGRNVHLRFPRAEIGSAWVHGQIRQLPRLDADLRGTGGAIEVTAQGLVVNVSHGTLHERALVQHVALNGAGALSLNVPFAEQAPMAIDTSFSGTLGELPILLTASMKGDAVHAQAALSPTPAHGMREVLPSFPFQDPFAAHLEVDGNLPTLNADCYARLGASEFHALGSVNVSEPIRARLDAKIHNFDLRALGTSFPQSNLNVVLTANGKFDKHIRGLATMRVEPSRIAKIAVPRIHATAEFDNDVISLKGWLADAHDSARFHIETERDRGQFVVAGDLSASTDLSRYSPVAPNISGQVRLKGAGRLCLGNRPTTDVAVLVQAEQLRVAGVSIARSSSNLQVSGFVDDPQVALGVINEEIVYQSQHFPRAALLARGPLSAATVSVAVQGDKDRPQLFVTAAIQYGPRRVDITSPHINLWRGRKYLDIQADKVRLEHGGISIERASASGSCNPLQFEGRGDRSSIAFKAQGHGVQLGDIAYVLGRDAQTDAVMDLNIDLHLSRTRTLGKLDLALQQVNVSELGRGAIAANLNLEQRRVAGAINGEIGPYSLHLQADDFTLAGPAQVIGSWRDATGKIALDASIDLGKLKSALPEGAVPFDILTGFIDLSGKFERTRPDAPPELAISAKTHRLSLSRKGAEQPRFDSKVVHAPPKWKVEGVDF